MPILPAAYASARQSLEFHEVSYGTGGIELYPVDEVESAQIGYSVDADGNSLVGNDDGDWSEDWIVIGHETGFGDPIFLSTAPPYPVFTAMHGEGAWDPSSIAPSLEQFWRCLRVFKRFAAPHGSFIDAEANVRSEDEIEDYLQQITEICGADADAVFSWALWAGIDLLARQAASPPEQPPTGHD